MPVLDLLVPYAERLGADAIEDGEESALEGVAKHPSWRSAKFLVQKPEGVACGKRAVQAQPAIQCTQRAFTLHPLRWLSGQKQSCVRPLHAFNSASKSPTAARPLSCGCTVTLWTRRGQAEESEGARAGQLLGRSLTASRADTAAHAKAQASLRRPPALLGVAHFNCLF